MTRWLYSSVLRSNNPMLEGHVYETKTVFGAIYCHHYYAFLRIDGTQNYVLVIDEIRVLSGM